jgi:hypothetical protein
VASPANYQGKRVLVVAAFDSFLRAASFYALHLEAGGAHVDYVLHEARPNQLSLAQAKAAGLNAVPVTLAMAAVLAKMRSGYDIVVLGLDGARTRRVTLALHELAERTPAFSRPILISVFPGILFRFQIEAMFCRMSSDLLLLNSPHDFALYESARRGLGLDASNAMMAGLSAVPRRREPKATTREGAIVYVAQPTVPAWRHERMYIVDRLAALAERCQRRDVVIKPRHRKNETTLHVEYDPFEDMVAQVAKLRALPPNLRVSHAPLRELLDGAGGCLTVSSTAALEALALGVPTRVLTDVGIHEHLGNHFFLESGLLCGFDAIEENFDYRLDAAWAARHLASAEEQLVEFDRRVLDLLDGRRVTPRLPLPGGRLFGRPATFDAFVRTHFDAERLSLVAEGRPGPRAKAKRAVKRLLKALGLRA